MKYASWPVIFRGKGPRLLLITDHKYVSALLFHGYGLPPWYDLPEIQRKSSYRDRATEHVGRIVAQAREKGFNQCDVHEAFPVNLRTISADVLVLRNLDRFLPGRSYSGVALLRENFSGVPIQPRRRLLKAMRLDGKPLDETAVLVNWFQSHDIPVVYSEVVRPYFRKVAAWDRQGICRPELPARFPAKLTCEFGAEILQRHAKGLPGVTGCGKRSISFAVADADALLNCYRYAGVLIQAMRKF